MSNTTGLAPAKTVDLGPLSKLPVQPLGDVLAALPGVLAEVAAEAEDLAAPDRLRGLVAETQNLPAVTLLAHTLPPREAIWWACVNVRAVLGDSPEDAAQVPALTAAEAWVYHPDETHRRACQAAADALGNEGMGALCSLAVFFAGDTLSEPNLPKVSPPPGVVGNMVMAAVNLAAVHLVPDLAMERLARAVRQGVDIANGGNGRVS